MQKANWVSTKEREPNRMHTLILCYDTPTYLGIVDEAKFDYDKGKWFDCYLRTWIMEDRIKAWMELPEVFTEDK